MSNKKKYKALMVDLDGTTIPNERNGMPTAKVIEAIRKASKKLHVGIVTGRPYYAAKPITKVLSLNAPSIVTGGTQIVDLATDAILWEKKISAKDAMSICASLLRHKVPILIFGGAIDNAPEIYFDPTYKLKETSCITVEEISQRKADEIFIELKKFPKISAQKIVGWKKGTVWIQISHIEATKQHGIFEVAKLLKIEPHEIIGVGDGYNDFPLLMACGFKVAMGNAVDELKVIADYIAPPVEEDGLVDVIEKFILSLE